jgi:hypothetical protein
MDWLQFVSVVAIPAFVGLLVLHFRHRAHDDVRHKELTDKLTATQRELDAYKLIVSQTYASQGYLKDVESRLVQALGKIEDKLDRVLGLASLEPGR